MKILLIYPPFLDDRLQAEDAGVVPIGAYYVGSLLKEHGYDVEILNWFDINKTPEKIEAILRDKKPDVIGFSLVHANRWGGIDIARIAKSILPAVNIVFGGIGATFLWEHLLRNFREIDYIVLGEGEYSFLNLVRCLERGEDARIPAIRGIAYRREQKPVKTAAAEFVSDLDQLPMPSKFFAFQHVSSSRGCPSNCAFCGSPRFWGRKVRFQSPGYFVEQLDQLCKKGVSFFYFSDDTFTMRENRAIDICKIIVEKGLKISWFAISRVNYVSEEMLYWMRKAGCIQISYGVESGSEKIRKTLCKNIKTEDIKKAFALTSQYGILPRAYFIYGSPGETQKTIQETVDLMREIRPLSMISYILDIFPGTALYEDFQKRTRLGDDIWLEKIEDIMYCETDQKLSEDKILSFGHKLRTEYYRSLPGFADAISLADMEDLSECHADFLSRLGMTFSHGDYASIDTIPDKEGVAERLFTRALSYFPDHRAYLGLGILKQKQGKYEESITLLSEGVQHFPASEQLALCLGLSYMNLAHYTKALEYFDRFPDSPQVEPYRAACHRALGYS